MTLLHKIKDYYNGHDMEDDGYWTFYQPRSFFNSRPYDGKFKVHRTHEQIAQVVPQLILLLQDSRVAGFKHKSPSTPSIPIYAHLLPPIFIYATEKDKAYVGQLLDTIGLEDKVWIPDTREGIELLAAELALQKNRTA